jgi:hypothetical protein
MLQQKEKNVLAKGKTNIAETCLGWSGKLKSTRQEPNLVRF